MFKTLLAGAATLAALPVIAQTGNPTTNTPAGATTTPNSVATGNQVNTNAQSVPNASADHSMHTMTATPNATTSSDVASDETAADVDAATPAVADGAMNSQTMTPTMDRSATASSGMQTPTYSGVGGPAESKSYPACSRTVTDSCVQPRGR